MSRPRVLKERINAVGHDVADVSGGVNFQVLEPHEMTLKSRFKPILINRWIELLDSYPVPDFIAEFTNGFTHGFRIRASGPPRLSRSRNHQFTTETATIVANAILKEVQADRIRGPFEKPLPNMTISPIGIIPKKYTDPHSFSTSRILTVAQ